MDSRIIKRAGDTADIVLQKLLEAIVNGTFVAGAPIRETQLAKDWGVSRTPVREAVRSAAAMGLIELRPNQRPLVRKFGQKDLVKLTHVRVAIELLAFDSSTHILVGSKNVKKHLDTCIELQKIDPNNLPIKKALKLDARVHRLWVDSSDNQFIVLAFDSLWTFIRILQRAAANDLNRVAIAISEHTEILRAVHEGNISIARDLLERHIRSSTPVLQALLKKVKQKTDLKST